VRPLTAAAPPAATRAAASQALSCQPLARGDSGFAAFQLGARALNDALAVAESAQGVASALVLCRAAVLCFLSAQLARGAGATTPPALPPDRWAALQELSGMARTLERLPTAQQARIAALLLATFDESELASSSAGELERDLAALRSIAFALGDPLENSARAARRQRAARLLRRAAVCCVLAAVLGWGLASALRRPNLALRRPVAVQSSDPIFHINPAQVVDGDRTNLGFHTTTRDPKSVTIDLQVPRHIRRIDVYNRLDCCQDRAVPLSIEVSSDGQRFTRVAHRERRFALWKVKLSPLEVRWVRLVDEGDQAFHLSEIEVY